MEYILNQARIIFSKHLLLVVVLSYFIILSFFMLWHGMWLSPDQFLIAGFLVALLLAKPLIFLKDWVPFISVFLAYEYLRGLVPKLGGYVNIFPMIDADRFLFGSLPTVDLQRLLYTPGQPRFYDYIFTVLYMMHFIVPLVFAFYLWIYKKKYFRKFIIALAALSFAGFFTYVLYPAMPPWMAAEKGFIPPVFNIFNDTLQTFVKTSSLPSIYSFMSPNPVAAMPSLHAAYPLLVYLFMVKVFGKKAKFLILYPVAVWFTIIYTGHHYFVDALVGVIYVIVIYRAVDWFYSRKNENILSKKPLTS